MPLWSARKAWRKKVLEDTLRKHLPAFPDIGHGSLGSHSWTEEYYWARTVCQSPKNRPSCKPSWNPGFLGSFSVNTVEQVNRASSTTVSLDIPDSVTFFKRIIIKSMFPSNLSESSCTMQLVFPKSTRPKPTVLRIIVSRRRRDLCPSQVSFIHFQQTMESGIWHDPNVHPSWIYFRSYSRRNHRQAFSSCASWLIGTLYIVQPLCGLFVLETKLETRFARCEVTYYCQYHRWCTKISGVDRCTISRGQTKNHCSQCTSVEARMYIVSLLTPPVAASECIKV